MTDQAESADERALRRELQSLAKKRESLINSSSTCCCYYVAAMEALRDAYDGLIFYCARSIERRVHGAAGRGATGRGSVFARLGGKLNRTGRQVVQLTERSSRGSRQGKRSHEDAQASNAGKRQKLHSAVARPEGSWNREVRADSDKDSATAVAPSLSHAHAQERKQRAVAPYAQKDGIARSRRMFGALMGHLGRAKQQIEKDTDLFKRQDTKQHEAEQREKAQSKNLEDQARQIAEIARLEALVTRTELDRSEQIARAKLEHLRMIRKSESQSKFLTTIASPPITYLPSRHTKETRELVAASMEAHEAKIKASERSHEENLRKLEAEFATKLKQLRDDLKAVKNDEVEEAGDGQSASEKEDDAMQGGDLHMMEGSEGELEEDSEHGQRAASEHSNGSPAMIADDEKMVQQFLCDGKADDSTGPVSIRAEDSRKTVAGSASHDCRDETEHLENANGAVEDHSDAEASSPCDVKGEGKRSELAEESPQPSDRSARTIVSKTGDEAATVSQSDAAMAARDEEPCTTTIDVDKMKVAELRAELKTRGLDTKGCKAKLVQRLKQDDT